MKRSSIARRLFVGLGAGVAVAFAIAGVVVHVLAARSLATQFDETLVANARALTLLVEHDDGLLESDIPAEGLPGDYYELRASDGTSVMRSASLGEHHLDVRDQAGATRLDDITLDGRTVRRVLVAFVPRSEDVDHASVSARPLARLAYARGRDQVDATLAALDRVLLGVGIGATLLALVLAALIGRLALRPVRALASSIGALDATHLATRIVPDASPTELTVIVERLNELLGRLDAAFARERQLTSEIAHELRTPLAGLRATIELALSRERSPERYQAALADCLSICIAAERLVAALLSLARLDAGQVHVRREPVQLDDLVREILAGVAARAAERELTIHTELPPQCVDTDPELLRSVVTNLVDNAISYADRGGTLRVSLAPGPVLDIANTGCTLAAADVPNVFRRFWRGDDARSGGTHAGLGLALARELVHALGGTIEARVDDGWFVVTVSGTARA